MKYTMFSVLILIIGTLNSYGKDNKQFEAFARTQDSLTHIACYDNNIPACKRYSDEFMNEYSKLDIKDRETYKDYKDDFYYSTACAYARNNEVDNTILYLQKVENNDYSSLQQDPAFNNIHSDARFVSYLNKVKQQKGKYQLLLKADDEYNTAEHNNIPLFTYQSSNNTNLMALKKAYNLDSIAGSGDDVTQIINLMVWVHTLITHDGSKGNPDVKNAMSLIKECKSNNKTLNCRGMAIVLNEIYLAKGFKSRFVTCLPKDTTDNDCHVITMVWTSSLNKWLWMDPTFMAYVMDETGELLSIEEVRERLINDRPLIINPDANHNRENGETKSFYLGYYMSKNLYQLECPLESQYDYETYATHKSRSYLQLVPGITVQQPKVFKDKNGVVVRTLYYTNNPELFWAPPVQEATAKAANTNKHNPADYQVVMDQFKVGYNNASAAAVNSMFIKGHGFFTDKSLTALKQKYGTMKSCTFLGMDISDSYDGIALFKIVCDNSVHCMAISLHEDGKFADFRFQTYNNYIDWLLAKSIDKDKTGK